MAGVAETAASREIAPASPAQHLAFALAHPATPAIAVATAVAANLLLDKIRSAQAATDGLLAQAQIVLGTTSAFQLFAWFAAFALLASADRNSSAQRTAPAIIIAVALLLANIAGEPLLFALAATAGAGWLALSRKGDAAMRAAGAVFLAIAINGVWGPLAFSICADEILRADAALAMGAMKTLPTQLSWSGGAIRAPDGHSITILDQCSAFHNITLAILCYTSVAMYRRQRWMRHDLAVMAAVCGLMIALNSLRIALMAAGRASYIYWHNGDGASLFAALMAFTIAGAAWAGSSYVERKT